MDNIFIANSENSKVLSRVAKIFKTTRRKMCWVQMQIQCFHIVRQQTVNQWLEIGATDNDETKHNLLVKSFSQQCLSKCLHQTVQQTYFLSSYANPLLIMSCQRLSITFSLKKTVLICVNKKTRQQTYIICMKSLVMVLVDLYLWTQQHNFDCFS